MKSTRVVATRVRGGRCEADWIGQRGEPRCSLEDRGCQGMLLTTVSDTCGKDGSAEARRRRSNGTARHPVWPEHCQQQRCTIRPPTTKAPKPRRTSAGEESIHLWAASRPGHRQSHSLRSNLTRPVSWLGPASSGVYPHTKGARCFAGGHRHRIPSTASGLLAPRSLAGQGVRRPLTDGRKHLDQRNRDERDSIGAMTFSPCQS
jgi:hypothetical protein